MPAFLPRRPPIAVSNVSAGFAGSPVRTNDQAATTFADILANRAARSPDKLAFVFLDARGEAADRLTFAELDRRASTLASTIQSLGIAGRTVMLVFPPSLDFVVALFACFRAGVIAVPIPFTAGRRTEDRFAGICRDAAPALVLSISTFTGIPKLRDLLAGNGHPPDWLFIDQPTAAQPRPSPQAPGADAIAMLQYTSGSTGAPKGVMLSHANLVANSAMLAAAFGHDENSRGVGWLPLFHDMGLVGHVLQPVFVGGLSVLMSPFTFVQRPQRWLEAISTWRATTSGGPSHAFALCLRSIGHLPENIDLSSWKTAYCGAERVRSETLEAFAAKFAPNGFAKAALHPCYGLAEATLLVSSVAPASRLTHQTPIGTPPGQTAPPSISCGHPWLDSRIEVVGTQSTSSVPDRVIGEILVRGPHLAQGYWGREAETASTFQTDAAGRLLRTGDLGFMSGGELFVVGRLKDTIIAFGVKYAAEDIEATIALVDPDFARHPCAAFAVDDGEREAVIVLQEVSSDATLLHQSVARARAQVTAEHGLRLTEFRLLRRGTLPCTSSGKVRRGLARTQFIEGRLPALQATQAQAHSLARHDA